MAASVVNKIEYLVLLVAAFATGSNVSEAQERQRLSLPNHELLSSERVLQVMQDSEGFLWYATEGGGVCRDDGRQMLVFRSDAEHPDLLGSNDVACLAEASPPLSNSGQARDKGRYIIIGTFHGANILNKQDYSIRQLVEVDDKRVDDILVGRDGHWWLTCNKKVYEYSANGRLLNVYPGGDKYICRLREDNQGCLLGMEWEGGILRLEDGRFVRIATEWTDSVRLSRVMTDRQGRQLVADGFGGCYALADDDQKPWFDGQILTRFMADSIRTSRSLSTRPTAVAVSKEGECWFSTGKEIRRMKDGKETVISHTKDVSAMAFTPDGTLWLATIFGQLCRYHDGKVEADEYGLNEYGDGVIAMTADSAGRLVLVYDRYVRIYDTRRHTLRQQSREAAGVYCIELQETAPDSRWSQPQEKPVERMPQWVWWTLAVLCLILVALTGHIWVLYRQRKRFLAAIKKEVALPEQANDDDNQPAAQEKEQPTLNDEWLQSAIAKVEAHLNDDSYSVEQLASDLCMSRMTFYRKIQSATGQKPTEFMRTIRLRRAAELLREGRRTITEIAYDTGFSSVSYFSRCFRTMYGVPPTQFLPCKRPEVERTAEPGNAAERGKATTADDLPANEHRN